MDNKENSYTITDILYYVLKMKWLVIALAIICGVAGYYYSIINYQPLYIAQATMVVNVKNEPDKNMTGTVSDGSGTNDLVNQPSSSEIFLAQKLVDTYKIILRSNAVMQSVVDDLNLNLPPAAVGSFINLNAVKDTQIMYVTVTCEDPKMAMDIANSLMKVAPSAMMKSVETGTVNVVDKAELPMAPIPLDYSKYTGIGALGGLAAGVVIALLFGMLFGKVRNSKDIEDKLELETIGEIPHVKKKDRKDDNILITNDGQADYTQAFMILSNITHYISSKQQSLKTIIVTSATEGEGKTTVATNMALGLMKMGKKVLVVDCDFRKPTIRKMFYISSRSSLGVMSVLKSNTDLDDSVVTHSSGVDVLPGFMPVNDPLDKTVLDRLQTILTVSKSVYDYIIIDTSPSYIVSDAAVISSLADGIVLVTRQEHSSLTVITDTIVNLKKCGANILGCVLNDIRAAGSNKYRYYRYSKYYKKSEESTKEITA